MKIISIVIAMLYLLAFNGCARANVSKNREAYILSQPHGWIEISVTDSAVPSTLPSKDIPSEKRENWQPHPPSCDFVVTLNNERFLREPIFPFGNQPPYMVKTGFRFPAPVGEFNIVVQYLGCDIEEEEIASKSFSSSITIDENLVTPIFLDGESITTGATQDNTVITLEDIYRKLDR